MQSEHIGAGQCEVQRRGEARLALMDRFPLTYTQDACQCRWCLL